MEFQELFAKLNEGKLAPPTDRRKWEEAGDRISIHAKGIRPQFNNPRNRRGAGGLITPANYEERYQYLFDNYILNRHPNEQEEHYQFRLSVYPLLAQDVYLRGKEQVGGSIFQASQYTIAANDVEGQNYLEQIDFDKRVKDEFFEHILTDPFGKFAVVEMHEGEFGSDEAALPDVELVESRYILYYEPKQRILFRSRNDVEGRKLLYYLDRQYCIKLLQTEERKKEYNVVAAYEHALGLLPVVDNNKELFKSFVTWADLIARNFSDDEIVAKNNNHPHIQMVESVCNECMGQRVKSYSCDSCESGMQEENCRTCKGRGTISINPGEVHVIRESEFRPGELNAGQGMMDRIKFINPDVSISKNSFERCWSIYEAGLRSLHLKYTEDNQSGVAKAIDREQLYLLISSCSTHIFDVADKILRLLFGYLQMGIAAHRPYTIEQPTQFRIKTEGDVQQEIIALKDADLSVRRQKTDEYMQIEYSGNQVELKKWNIIKVWDSLYCMTNDELNSRQTLGSAQTIDFIKHDKVEVLLNNLILDKGVGWFLNASVREVTALLDGEAGQ
jgi:hypothetical protein